MSTRQAWHLTRWGRACLFLGSIRLAVPVLVRAFGRSKSEQVGFSLVLALLNSEASANVSADELAKLLSAYPSNVRTAGGKLLKRLGVYLEKQKAGPAERAPGGGGGATRRVPGPRRGGVARRGPSRYHGGPRGSRGGSGPPTAGASTSVLRTREMRTQKLAGRRA